MKTKIAAIFLTLLLQACTFTYRVGVDKNASPDQYSTINFANQYYVSKIDGQKFSRTFSIWDDNSHSIKLKPGQHTFSSM